MKSKISHLLIAFAFFAGFTFSAQAQSGGQFRLSPSTSTIEPGASVSLELQILTGGESINSYGTVIDITGSVPADLGITPQPPANYTTALENIVDNGTSKTIELQAYDLNSSFSSTSFTTIATITYTAPSSGSALFTLDPDPSAIQVTGVGDILSSGFSETYTFESATTDPTCTEIGHSTPSTDPACGTTPATGATMCVEGGTYYCCPTGQEPIDGLCQTPDTDPTTTSANLKFRMAGITRASVSRPVTLTLKENVPIVKKGLGDGGAKIQEFALTATTDAAGTGAFEASVADLPVGTYKLCLKSDSHLQRCFNDITLSADAAANSFDFSTVSTQRLVVGDVTGDTIGANDPDNLVTSRDISTILSYYSGSFVINSGFPANMDVNADGRITIDDHALASLTFNEFIVRGDE